MLACLLTTWIPRPHCACSKRLRSLASDSLPLRVVAVQPLAPVLRHAAAFPPLPHLLAGAPHDALASEHVARCLEPVELLCQLEGSGACLRSLHAPAANRCGCCTVGSLVGSA